LSESEKNDNIKKRKGGKIERKKERKKERKETME